MSEYPPIAGDLLVGATAIAEFLGIDRRSVYNCHQMDHLPIFTIGATLVCRKSTLSNWVLEREKTSPAFNRGLQRA